jgi:hypothetical protein
VPPFNEVKRRRHLTENPGEPTTAVMIRVTPRRVKSCSKVSLGRSLAGRVAMLAAAVYPTARVVWRAMAAA